MSNKGFRISRRDALKATAGAAVTAALAPGFSTPVDAAAPMLGLKRPTVYRFKVGEFEVTNILDGVVVREGPHPIFGQNQPAETVAAYAKANHLPGDKIENPYTPTLVNTGKELVLFDSGNGARRRGKGAGNLLAGLKEAGYSADQVDVVVITHGHPDHVGGLLEDGKPAFANARYVFGEVDFDYWNKGENIPERRKTTRDIYMKQAAPLAPKASFIKPGADVVTGITSIGTFGHSPGHLSFHVESAGKRLVIWADVCNHYVMSLQKPEWHVSFDHDKDMAIAARRKIFDLVTADQIPAVGYHMPFPAIGYVEKSGDSYRWVAGELPDEPLIA